ncbi:MAG TPA: hypothetical protein VN541_14460, partial [Tepidisphaeraceae bacterium]|nr:hypothetical protein [Tepidisphaeraceae bacterium]
QVRETTFLGQSSEHVVVINKQPVKVIIAPPLFDPPRELTIEFDPGQIIVLPAEGNRSPAVEAVCG